MNLFIVKVILSFIVGGMWVALTTVLAERFGTKIGGVIGGLPSTMLVSLFFIGWTQSAQVAAEATSAIPLILGIDAFFIVVYIYLSQKSFALGVFSALGLWLVLALGLVFMRFDNFAYSLVGFTFLVVISYHLVKRRSDIKSQSRKEVHYTVLMLLLRGFFGGTIIATAVVFAKVSGPLMGGAFSVFPAVYLSTILITYYAHGKDFSFAVMKVLMISGTVGTVIFAIGVRYLYVPLGIILGTLISFGLSLITNYLTYIFVKHRTD